MEDVRNVTYNIQIVQLVRLQSVQHVQLVTLWKMERAMIRIHVFQIVLPVRQLLAVHAQLDTSLIISALVPFAAVNTQTVQHATLPIVSHVKVVTFWKTIRVISAIQGF